MNEELLNSAMSIIMLSGDARVFCKEALEAVANADFIKCQEKLKEAYNKIVEAHRIQTDAVQEEIRGERSEYSLLFAHAQDTLMTIYSEINIVKQLSNIFAVYEQRISNLEKGISH